MTFLVEPMLMSKFISTSFAPCDQYDPHCQCRCMNDCDCGPADL